MPEILRHYFDPHERGTTLSPAKEKSSNVLQNGKSRFELTGWLRTNCCGAHFTSIPKPEDATFSTRPADRLANGDAKQKICNEGFKVLFDVMRFQAYKWDIFVYEALYDLF